MYYPTYFELFNVLYRRVFDYTMYHTMHYWIIPCSIPSIITHIIGLYYSLYLVLSTYTMYSTTYYSTIPRIIHYTMYYIPCIIEVCSVWYWALFDYSMYYTSIFNISYWNWLLFVHVVYLLLDYLYCCVLFSLNPIGFCYCFSTLSIHICSNCASPKWHI